MASSEDSLDDVAVHVCQPAFNAVMVESQFLVVYTHQVQQGCVEVVPVYRILNRLPADFIRLSEAEPRLYPPSS